MISKKKNKEKDTRTNPGSESKLEAIARSLRRKIQFRKSSESKANARGQYGGKNAEGSIHVGAHSSPSAPESVALSSDELDPSAHHSPTTISPPLRSQHQQIKLLPTDVSGSQAIHMQSYGGQNWLHVGDDNRDNKGIIVRVSGGNAHIYARDRSASPSFKYVSMKIAVIFIEATQQVLHDFFGNAIVDPPSEYENDRSEEKLVEEYFGRLIEYIKYVMESDGPNIQQKLRDHLRDLLSGLFLTYEQSFEAKDDSVEIETLARAIIWKLRLFLFVIHVAGHIPSLRLAEMVKKRIAEVRKNIEAITSWQSAKDLPCARAAYDDYVSGNHRRASCFEGTRQALLDAVAEWLANSEVGIFVLFGLAGIGKSTIAQTIAKKADDVQLLGASFFFSRNEAERRTAEKFFTTIAFKLCLHDAEYAEAIGKVVRTDAGKDATGKHPLEQLEALILEPLQNLACRTVVIVIDALDECDESDGPIIVRGLHRLVQCLPSFKVLLTTRPQPHLQLLLDNPTSKKIFHLHDIEDRIVDGDIELYLRHNLSSEQVKVHLPKLRNPWAASDGEIESLVRGAGRLFIIASTAVLFILDKTSTPSSRMKELRTALDQGFTPFNKLNDFYTVILRNAVPKDCEPDTVKLYQSVIGAIILLQHPLPVSALAKLIGVEVNEVTTVLGNLESVILLGSNDVPVIYHKSFPDYIQDPSRCKDVDLHIDPMFHHTRMATYCLRYLNQRLKQNILDLGDPARFMDNGEALETQGLTESDVQEKIPSESRYACSYFGNHIQYADDEANPARELEQFFDERFLNWLETLSWIGKLATAHRTILTVQKKLKPTSSDLRRLVTDGQRFVWKFYDLIRRSALHTYHSALPLTPTETSLYMRYSKQGSFCLVRGGPKKWDAVVTNINCGANQVVFSQDSALLACFVENWRRDNESDKIISDPGFVAIHDAVAGIPLGRIEGVVSAISNDFSRAAAFDNSSITLYNVKDFTPVAIIKPLAAVIKLALSPDGSRLVAGLDDGTVSLWDAEKCDQIKSYARWKKDSLVIFSSDGSRVAFASHDEVVKLLDGMSGNSVTDLQFPGLGQPRLRFSGDGSRLACLAVRAYGESEEETESTLRVWDSQDGSLIGMAENITEDQMAISTDGSLVATGHKTVKLWSGNDLALLETPSLDLEPDSWIWSLTFHNDVLGIGFLFFVALYDINSHTLIARLPFESSSVIAFSPDNSRLAAGSYEVRLWDVSSITSNFTSQDELSMPTRLAFPPDCLCLASSHVDGTIRLWDTSNMALITAHKGHSTRVRELKFSVEGGKFASGSEDGIIQLWNGKDGALDGFLEGSGKPTALALSSSMLAAATDASITLWDLRTQTTIATLNQHGNTRLVFSQHHPLLAAATVTQGEDQNYQSTLMLWDIEKLACITTFNLRSGTEKIQFLEDDSQLAVQCWDDSFHLFNFHEGKQSIVSENQAISWLHICPSWHGIPVWMKWANDGRKILGRFPQQEKAFSVLNCASLQLERTDVGSTMIALGCQDGRILLINAVSKS